ncbi:C-type lectin domain family 12 member A-like isoform X3 [Mobula birostris]|uniref:C-type lectin domain family 12 member A-like isoform X3 n=1 Tax=Mobula birostris TaxID=1983395 RepID=UPI003B27E1DA
MNRTQRQYQQQVHELNSTLKSRTSENSHLDFSQRNCLKSISALNNNLSKLENNITILNSELSELNQTHTDLRHECNQLETKYRAITETKNQICQYLSRRREQTCPPYWTEKEGWCYFISTSVKSYDGAREHCSKFDARLLEINSNVEKHFVFSGVSRYTTYWIGKWENRT